MAAGKKDTEVGNQVENNREKTMTAEEIEKMIQAAKAEAVAEYEKSQVSTAAPKKADTEPEERVTIELFRDNDKYNNDLVVGVNGKYYQIRRGIPVDVPKSVAEVIANSKKQDYNAAEYSIRKEQEYIQRSKELGV